MDFKADFLLLKSKILKIFNDEYQQIKDAEEFKSRKEDNSWVTEIDKKISDIVINFYKEKGVFVLSEEADKKELKFPCVIVDPIDGTRELVNEIPEFCLSLAYMNSNRFDDEKNVSWIFNPVTGLEIFSWDIHKRHTHFISKDHLRGFISRNGYRPEISEKLLKHDILVSPFGSIALKIGMLAIGACNFVFSYKQKSAWDIAAGTHMTTKAGIICLSNGKKLETIDAIDIDGPLLWVREEHLDKLNKIL